MTRGLIGVFVCEQLICFFDQIIFRAGDQVASVCSRQMINEFSFMHHAVYFSSQCSGLQQHELLKVDNPVRRPLPSRCRHNRGAKAHAGQACMHRQTHTCVSPCAARNAPSSTGMHNASKHTPEPMCIPVAGHMGLSAALFSSHMQPAHALTCFQLLVLGEEPNILTTACAPPTPNRLARVGTYSLTHSRCIHPRRPTPYVQLVHPF